ncbi:hypothetical protein Landi51_01146 [Colletotrichum acutatum]
MMLRAVICLVTTAIVLTLTRRDVNPDAISVVNLAVDRGESQHGASGVLYSLPLDQNQIPDKWFIDMDYGYSPRGGGSSLTAGGHAWITSFNDYKVRMNGVIFNYRIVRKYNSTCTTMMSDLWGADGGQRETNGPSPGDGGDWTQWDQFLAQVVKDLRQNDALEGMSLDIWNEPNGEVYWDRPQAQYHEAWAHAYVYLRKELPNTKLGGPAVNGTIPDEWEWHVLGTPDFETSRNFLWEPPDKYNLPHKPININEYAPDSEQTPVFSACGHLTKPGGGEPNVYNPKNQDYRATGQYLVYKYYGTGVQGHRVETLLSANKDFDVYATVEGNHLKMLYGSRCQTGSPPSVSTTSTSSVYHLLAIPRSKF